MSFETDKQTLEDLNILGKYKNNSIYSIFSHTVTRGGERLLEKMFLNPLTDAGDINRRTSVFSYWKDHDIAFPGETKECDVVEQYLSGASGKHWVFNLFVLGKAKVLEFIGNKSVLEQWHEQVLTTIFFLQKTRKYLSEIVKTIGNNPMEERVKRGIALLEEKAFREILDFRGEKLTLGEMFKFDKILRCDLNKKLLEHIGLFHEIDVNTVVGRVARERNFCFPVASGDSPVSMGIRGLFHPALPGAVSNDLEITRDKNIFFLTGANMAGKSTLMKSFGIAVYMAHMGFPVAARSMEFAIQDGLYTSINVPDNINMGYSHFYAEVLRVKKVAVEVSLSKRLVVIFDELFKGTNVKDAFDATLAVTEALAERRNSAFMISTHIIEVGQELGKHCDNVTFAYLPTVMKGKLPTYTYVLEPGITSDKHGMIIINNEKIIEIIKGEVV